MIFLWSAERDKDRLPEMSVTRMVGVSLIFVMAPSLLVARRTRLTQAQGAKRTYWQLGIF